MENIEEIIFTIRKRIYTFRIENNFESTAFIFDINAIEIAVSLIELGLKNERKIKKEEKVWFERERFIEDSIGSTKKWKDIFLLYSDLIRIVKKYDFWIN
ncbi:hypothetical protein [Flavobacterium fontis]|nr:hypothetical protein [Flavobacterium fontis]